jgi:hypothetical protein
MRLSLLALWLSVATVGCGKPSIKGDPLGNAGKGDMPDAPATPQPGDCGPVSTPRDPSTLPECCAPEGLAHCVPSSEVPASMAAQLNACPESSGICVPDPFIRSGGARPPEMKDCASLNGPGVCLSVCVKLVAQYSALLPQDTCAADERCAPCINPLTNLPSGACEIGKAGAGGTCGPDTPTNPDAPGTPAAPMCPYVGPPLLDPATLPACSVGGAHCVQNSLVPPKMAAQLAACPQAGSSCVPDEFITTAGNFIPPTCASLDGAEGRCLHVAIPQVDAQKGFLPQSTCKVYERCVPCYNPIDGIDTGSCKQSCDPGPTKPKTVFSDCCVDNNVAVGKCVPKEAISATLQKNLDNDTCDENKYLCVPKEHLDSKYVPKACSASGFLIGQYTGVCLSDCLKFGIQGIVLAKGNCADDYKCAPCKNPLTGAATGAPGCPATP